MKEELRVLIICGEPFNSESATGITLRNLFRGWNPASVYQIYSADIAPDRSFCTRYLRLSSRDLVGRDFLWKRESVPLSDRGGLCAVETRGQRKSDWVAQMRGRLRGFGQWLDWLPYRLARESLDDIRRFNPHVIYTTLGNMRLARLARRLSRILAIPVVPHFLDDWLSTYDSSGGRSLMARLARPWLVSETRKVLDVAPFAFAISDLMADEYYERFSVPFKTFVNPPDVPIRKPRIYSVVGSSKPLKLVYTGGMHLGRARVLRSFAVCVDHLVRKGRNLELNLYVPQRDIAYAQDTLGGLRGVVVRGSIAPEQVACVLDNSDLAIHVESFDPAYRAYTRLSVSTKIPQYLASGLPVIACCPDDLASGRHIAENNCGIVIGDSIAQVELALDSLMTQPALMRSLSENAIRVAQARHDGEAQRLKFRSALERFVERGSVTVTFE